MHQDDTDKSEIQQPGVDILTGIPITAQGKYVLVNCIECEEKAFKR